MVWHAISQIFYPFLTKNMRVLTVKIQGYMYSVSIVSMNVASTFLFILDNRKDRRPVSLLIKPFKEVHLFVL